MAPTGPAPADDVTTGRGPDVATFPAEATLPEGSVVYGPDIADERTLKLLGALGRIEGKRILELGCGSGHNAVVLAKQGAKVITIDPSSDRLERVRINADKAAVKVELHQGDPAEVAFVRAETIDAAIAVYTFATVPDLDRVFRQVHRVLRREGTLLFSIPHPAFALVGPEGDDPRIVRSYFDRAPRPWTAPGAEGTEHRRSMGEIVTSLLRNNFRVDTVLEPQPAAGAPRSSFWVPAMEVVPSTLIIRARKEGL